MAGSSERPTKTCPYCGETILEVAVKCRYCKSDVASNEQRVAALQAKIGKLNAEREDLPWYDTVEHEDEIEDAEADILSLQRRIEMERRRADAPPPVPSPPPAFGSGSTLGGRHDTAQPAVHGALAPPSWPHPAASAFTRPSAPKQGGSRLGIGTILVAVVLAVIGMLFGALLIQYFQVVRPADFGVGLMFYLGFSWFAAVLGIFSKSPPVVPGILRAVVAIGVLTLPAVFVTMGLQESVAVAGARTVATVDFRRVKVDPTAFVDRVIGCRVVGGTPSAPEPLPSLPPESGVPIPSGSTIGRLGCGEDDSAWLVIVPPSRTNRFLGLRSGDVVAVRLIQPFVRFGNPSAVLLLQ